MSVRPEALQLADELDACPSINYHRHAAELRRLHRLIAAAPDRLEALNDIVQLWDHHCHAHGDGCPSPLHAKAIAAIAKAEGSK